MSGASEIEDRAARWLIRRENAEWSAADQLEMDGWLNESMAHKAAFWRLEYGWRKADRIRALGAGLSYDPQAARAVTRRWRMEASIAASLIAVVGIGATLHQLGKADPALVITPKSATFHTPIGGHRTIPLGDGSKVELNTATLLRTGVTDKHREVWLDRGEAYFEVAHHEGVPFVVHAGSHTVTVLGTKFAVRKSGERVTVSVVEGRVRVDDASTQTAPSTIITAGVVAIARGQSMLLTSRSDKRVENELAWRAGMLMFNQSTLGEAAAEFNRYNRRRVEIADPETSSIRIGGTFQASNVDAFGRLLRDAYGLKIEYTADAVKISS